MRRAAMTALFSLTLAAGLASSACEREQKTVYESNRDGYIGRRDNDRNWDRDRDGTRYERDRFDRQDNWDRFEHHR